MYYIPYVIVVLFSAIATFASLSNGSFFTEYKKFAFLIVSILVLIACCVYMTLNYSWIHIFALVAEYIFAAWTFAAFFSK